MTGLIPHNPLFSIDIRLIRVVPVAVKWRVGGGAEGEWGPRFAEVLSAESQILGRGILRKISTHLVERCGDGDFQLECRFGSLVRRTVCGGGEEPRNKEHPEHTFRPMASAPVTRIRLTAKADLQDHESCSIRRQPIEIFAAVRDPLDLAAPMQLPSSLRSTPVPTQVCGSESKY